jgi:murein L,D-transpeptidase YafK
MSLRIGWWVALLYLFAACSHLPSSPPGPKPIRIDAPPLPAEYVLIDSKAQTLQLIRDGVPVKTFDNVAFGVAGVGTKRRQGDGVTPRGRFTVTTIRPSKRYRTFVGINYPLREDAERGLREGIINQKQFEVIMLAIEKGELPPQNTPLGGMLGIHGIGSNSLAIHREIDWTGGCVALENQQIDELVKMIRVGTTVVIQ